MKQGNSDTNFDLAASHKPMMPMLSITAQQLLPNLQLFIVEDWNGHPVKNLLMEQFRQRYATACVLNTSSITAYRYYEEGKDDIR